MISLKRRNTLYLHLHTTPSTDYIQNHLFDEIQISQMITYEGE